MIALAKAMTEQLRSEKVSLYSDEENTSDEDEADLIAKKLDDLAVGLNLTPYMMIKGIIQGNCFLSL